jgi:hypothetical protein
VDNVKARFEIAEILKELNNGRAYSNRTKILVGFWQQPTYRTSVLSTIGRSNNPIQRNTKRWQACHLLPMNLANLLKQSEQEDNTPSCTLAEALEHQDLFINSSLAQMGCSLLWNLFRRE